MDGQNFEQQPYVAPAQAPDSNKTSGMSIASLVLGIVGIVAGCCSPIVGIICGVIGVILGVLGNKQNKTKLGTAGLVVSIVAIAVSVVVWIISFVILSSAESAFTELLNSYY